MNDITSNECEIPSLKIQECMILILEIGVACSVAFSRERMNMGAVIIGLHSIREKTSWVMNIRSQRLQATGKFCFFVDVILFFFFEKHRCYTLIAPHSS